jgi:hypothetical protein
MTTGAITADVAYREPVAPTMSEEEAVAAILEGHRAGAYALPPPLIAAAEGATALTARAAAVHLELNAAAAALSAGPGRLVAEIVRESATSGAVAKTDIAAEMARLEAAMARLRHEDGVLQVAAEKVSSYPSTIIRSNAAAVASALDAALGELIAGARPHSAKIATVDPDAANPLVAAIRLDPKGYDLLDGSVPRFRALEAAEAALSRLGGHWAGLDTAPAVAEPVLRLAIMAAAQ